MSKLQGRQTNNKARRKGVVKANPNRRTSRALNQQGKGRR